MNKKYNKALLCIFIFICLIELFDHSTTVRETIYNSSKLWFYNLVPSILPMYLLIDIIINYDLLKPFNYIIKIFKIDNITSTIFLLSILSGFPSNSKYIKSYLDNNIITTLDANSLLTFTHFSNPLFIVESIGVNFLHNKSIGIIILISHYLGNIILGIVNKDNCIMNKNKLIKNKKNSFVTTLSNSITNTINILILLYGIITFFMIITSLINENRTINPIINSLICGILEITNGINLVSNLSISLVLKGIIITFFLSFGGLCIHMQVFSILKDYKLKYLNYLKIRIVHGIISSCLFYIIFTILKQLNGF